MKLNTLFFSAFSLLCVYACGAEYGRLAPDEADAIIAERFAKQAAIKSAKLERLNSMPIRSEARYVDDQGRTQIFRDLEMKVRPSINLGKSSSPVINRISSLSPEALLAAEAKSLETLSISATVFDSRATLLRWSHQGQRYTAWSNVDFNYFRGLSQIETESTSYLYLFGIGDVQSVEGRFDDSVQIPSSLPELSVSGPVYALPNGESLSLEASAGLDALLDYYAENDAELKLLHQRREALAAAHMRYVDKHPPEPETLIFNYYEVEGSKP